MAKITPEQKIYIKVYTEVIKKGGKSYLADTKAVQAVQDFKHYFNK